MEAVAGLRAHSCERLRVTGLVEITSYDEVRLPAVFEVVSMPICLLPGVNHGTGDDHGDVIDAASLNRCSDQAWVESWAS